MSTEPEFYTKTMARVYADQGHYDEAARIYRHLLEEQPGQQALVEALAEVEMIRAEARARKKDLVPLFKEWVGLALKYNSIRKLKRLRR
jgi:hypothetical protein